MRNGRNGKVNFKPGGELINTWKLIIIAVYMHDGYSYFKKQ